MAKKCTSEGKTSKLMAAVPIIFLVILTARPCLAWASIDHKAAAEAFLEARAFSASEKGRLWGAVLYGPMLFIDPVSRKVVANRPDEHGALKFEDGVYVGVLPAQQPVANSTLEWSGVRWTTVLWPLPTDAFSRRRLLAHELFHRLQPELHLQAKDAANPQLDMMEGRIWLQLEWRALARALVTSGPEQTQSVADAALFRRRRYDLYPGAAETERELELMEGLAEYTGVVVGANDRATATWLAIAKLVAPSVQTSFVRSFAYTSGPAIGLLLDARRPGWRLGLNAQTGDIARLLAATAPYLPSADLVTRSEFYGEVGLRAAEGARDRRATTLRDEYRDRLVNRPIISLPRSEQFTYSFNPDELVSLGEAGMVYPTLKATDAWGSVDVADGALVTSDQLILPAPTSSVGPSSHEISGPGWKLTLAPHWQLVPGARTGDFRAIGP